jgi:hypothetical protein
MRETTTIGDILDAPAPRTVLLGRARELARLESMLASPNSLVTFVCGMPGIGKTTLLNAFVARARAAGATVIHIDGNRLKPTADGFIGEVADQAGATPDTLGDVLGSVAGGLLITIDNFQALRLLDRWFRDTFLPAMPASLRVAVATCHTPGPGWLAREPWSSRTWLVELQPLEPAVSVQYLLGRGFSIAQAQHVNATAHGNPMALVIASSTTGRWAARSAPASLASVWLARVADAYLGSIDDPDLRRLVRELALLRRVSRPLLASLCPGADDGALFERLRGLPLMVTTGTGLAVHDAVREVLANSLDAEDPARAREVKRVAWSLLSAFFRESHDRDLWHHTADTIYLLSDPVVREAFFPRSANGHEVAPASPETGAAILQIARCHEGAAGAALIEAWWRDCPDAFRVVLDADGAVQGFYLAFDPARVPRAVAVRDPLVRAWIGDLRAVRMPSRQRALFIRRWLARAEGEAPCPVQAAAWLDLKRAYLEMAPDLRRVYLTLTDAAPYAEVAGRLGFTLPGELARDLDGVRYATAVLDMGPASVAGWLHRLLARELGIAPSDFLDPERQAVIIAGEPVALTPLEFKVAAYLYANSGTAVSRERLLNDVWGSDYTGGSNVVDAVIRTLRGKLGERAGWITTVRGHGYALAPDR